MANENTASGMENGLLSTKAVLQSFIQWDHQLETKVMRPKRG